MEYISKAIQPTSFTFSLDFSSSFFLAFESCGDFVASGLLSGVASFFGLLVFTESLSLFLPLVVTLLLSCDFDGVQAGPSCSSHDDVTASAIFVDFSLAIGAGELARTSGSNFCFGSTFVFLDLVVGRGVFSFTALDFLAALVCNGEKTFSLRVSTLCGS